MEKKNKKLTFAGIRNSRAFKIFYDGGILYFVLAFLIPVVIMYDAFREQSIHMLGFYNGEFQSKGENQMLVVDLWHQYYPFFRVVREKLLSGGSFLYSWQNGMGTNFLSLISYYAASPLNWLSVFFDDEHTRDALTYILMAKIGFAGSFFSCFLRYTFKRRDFSIVVFSSMFALCSYVLGYYWNVMWFDTVALFPLVMTGVVAICRERKWKLFTVTLALSLIANYYIAFFTCIFTIFMFAAGVVIEGGNFKDYMYKLWLIVRSSVIGICLGGFMLLPAYLGLKLTYSANNVMPVQISWYDKWTDIFANFLSYDAPTTKEGLPNLACGMLAVTLFGVFLFSAGIKIREKISASLMLALIVVSCNMNKLNFIWHGFHSTNQIPHRFAFIFSFVLIAAAYRAYDVIMEKGLKIYQIFLLVPAPAAVFVLNYITAKNSESGFIITSPLKKSFLMTEAYFLLFIAFKLTPIHNINIKKAMINICLAALVTTELSGTAVVGTSEVGTSAYDSYPYKNSGIQASLATMGERENSLFYRSEVATTYSLNDSALYGYNGVSQFSSSANVSVTRLFRRLGLYSSEAGNRYFYRNATPVANCLLDINYVMSKTGLLNNSEMNLRFIEENDGVALYESKYPLSLGFMMNGDILGLEDKDGANPFEYQNEVMRRASGSTVGIFTAQPVSMASYEGMEATKTGYGTYNFTKTENSGTAKAIYNFAGIDGAYLYGYARNDGIDSISAKCDGLSADNDINLKDYPIVFPMGNGQGESTLTAELTIDENSNSGNYTIVVYALDRNAFESAYRELADEQLEITEFSDTKITGNIDVKADGVMYLSIPYEKGWSIFVDGEKTETVKVLDSMLGVELESGSHRIVLKYSPDGFKTGLAVSGGALFMFIVLAFIDKKKNHARSADENLTEISENLSEAENEESESNDSVSGNEIPRISETEQCHDGSGDAGESGLEGSE